MQYKDSVCIFEEGNADCKGFSTMCLDGEDYKKFKERLNEKFPNMEISDDEARHLFSILVKYKRSPNIPKHKVSEFILPCNDYFIIFNQVEM